MALKQTTFSSIVLSIWICGFVGIDFLGGKISILGSVLGESGVSVLPV